MHGKRPEVDCSRARQELGIKDWIAPEETIMDMALALTNEQPQNMAASN